jgi:transposase
VREKLKQSYSETGRPSIDPELLLRILPIGYLYGITSERKLVEELRMHLAWRWFTGLGFDQEIDLQVLCPQPRWQSLRRGVHYGER